ncbi:MAG TPA: FHA domain-containing protein [Chthonomonadaceae bacterium]|nr:FHA domain-containing protein [Chthonomonadaceae bacterium]
MGGFGRDPIPGLQERPAADATGARTDPAAGPLLRVLNGPCAGRTFPLDPPPRALRIRIGRADPPEVTVDIDLTECELGSPAMISRRHAELLWVDGALHLVDLGSRNGTCIDGALVVSRDGGPSDPIPLANGCIIRLANLLLELAGMDRSAGQP